MTTGGGMTLNIDENLVKPVVEKEIEAAVIRELEKMPLLLPQMVSHVLLMPVSDRGEPSNSSYDKHRTYMNWVFQKAIQEATKEAIVNWLKNNNDALEKEVDKQLRASSSKFAKSVIDAFVGLANNSWRFSVNVELPKD